MESILDCVNSKQNYSSFLLRLNSFDFLPLLYTLLESNLTRLDEWAVWYDRTVLDLLLQDEKR